MQVFIIGGGPAGFMAAIACKQYNSSIDVTILERTGNPLAKLAASGLGYGNPAPAEPDVSFIVDGLLRGGQELHGALHQFGSTDIREWFAARDIRLITSSTGSILGHNQNDGQRMADCLLAEASRLGISVETHRHVLEVRPDSFSGGFRLWLKDGEPRQCDRLILAAGSSGKGFGLAEELGHTIVPTVPSLFTFHCEDARLRNLQGLTLPDAIVHAPKWAKHARGPLEMTPQGIGGLAIARLSAHIAHEAKLVDYKFTVHIHFAPSTGDGQPSKALRAIQYQYPHRTVITDPHWDIPPSLWERLCHAAGIDAALNWQRLSNRHLQTLAGQIAAAQFMVSGMSMYKPEWVKSGGVSREEIDFRSMQSKRHPALYFAGEVIDIDGLPGGYNLLAAFTTGHLSGKSAASN